MTNSKEEEEALQVVEVDSDVDEQETMEYDFDFGSCSSPEATPSRRQVVPKVTTRRKSDFRRYPKNTTKLWDSLEHNGPLFAPYEPLPDKVYLKYDGEPFRLSAKAEELASLYAKNLSKKSNHYEQVLQENFFNDWRASMTPEERELIVDPAKCDFGGISKHMKKIRSWRKSAKSSEKYGFCTIDGRRERVKNYMIDRTWIFKSVGNHLAGKVKRIIPEDVTINCSRDSVIPVPPEGHSWKKVVHDNTVSWLASWPCTITGLTTYMMPHDVSRLKIQADRRKFDKARELSTHLTEIRENYRADLAADNPTQIRQRGVAMFLVEKLALRLGFEKIINGTATFGVCSLLVEHVTFNELSNSQDTEVVFEFVSKCNVMYKRRVVVNPTVYHNLKEFQADKEPTDKLFDALTADDFNSYLKTFMPGLTAKVFRTTGACRLFQERLDKLEPANEMLNARLKLHSQAVQKVARRLNQCRSKNNEKQLKKLRDEVHAREHLISKCQGRIDNNPDKEEQEGEEIIRQEGKLQNLRLQIDTLENEMEPSLTTAFSNFLDPRITFAWCKRWSIPPKKIFKKGLYRKFEWAKNTDKDWRF